MFGIYFMFGVVLVIAIGGTIDFSIHDKKQMHKPNASTDE
jgi:hypothetical protein